MDKETLSNYGWIVIAVLVLVVMIALATPFGSFISGAVQSTTKGLFDVNKSALDNTGLINIAEQEFDVPDMNHGAEETPIAPEVELITFSVDGVTYQAEEGMTWAQWIDSSYNTANAYTDGAVRVVFPNNAGYYVKYKDLSGSIYGHMQVVANQELITSLSGEYNGGDAG